VAAADELYRNLPQGAARDIAIRHRRPVRTGWLARIAALRTLPFNQRLAVLMGSQAALLAALALAVDGAAWRVLAAAGSLAILAAWAELYRSIVTPLSQATEAVNALAGVSMRDVVAAVQGATAIMHDITLASRDQAQGIAQVNQAMAELDAISWSRNRPQPRPAWPGKPPACRRRCRYSRSGACMARRRPCRPLPALAQPARFHIVGPRPLRCSFSRVFWQSMQVSTVGVASSRSSGISLPHSTQIP
jgi:hypothetical protein